MARAEMLSDGIRSYEDAERSLTNLVVNTSETIQTGARTAQQALLTVSADVGAQLKQTSSEVESALAAVGSGTANAILASARDAQATLVTASTDVTSQIASLAADIERTLQAPSGFGHRRFGPFGAREAQTTLVAASSDAASQVGVAGRRRRTRAVDRRHRHFQQCGSNHRWRTEAQTNPGRRIFRCRQPGQVTAGLSTSNACSIVGTATAEAGSPPARAKPRLPWSPHLPMPQARSSCWLPTSNARCRSSAPPPRKLSPPARKPRARWITASTDVTSQVKSLTADVERSLSMAGTSTAESIVASARDAQGTLVAASTETANHIKSLSSDVERSGCRWPAVPPRKPSPPVRARHRARLSRPLADATSQVKSLAAEVQHSLSVVGNATSEAITAGARSAKYAGYRLLGRAANHVKSLAMDVERTLTTVGATAAAILGSALAKPKLRSRRPPRTRWVDQGDLVRHRAFARRGHCKYHRPHPDSAQNAQSALVAAANEVSSKVKTTSTDIERSVLAASSAFGSA